MTETIKDNKEAPITVVVFCQQEEVKEACWYFARQRYADSLVLTVFIFVFSAVAVGLLFFFQAVYRPIDAGSPSEVFLSRTLVVAGILLPFACASVLFQSLKQFVHSKCLKDRRFLLPTTYTLSMAGIQIGNPYFSFLADWQRVTAFFELPSTVSVIVDGIIFPIPKRCFASQAQFYAARKLVLSMHIPYSKFGRDVPIQYSKPAVVIKIDLAKGHDDASRKEETPANQATTKIAEQGPFANDGLMPGIEQPHPESTLISEPIVFKQRAQTLRLECSYTLPELKNIDRMLFLKYGLSAMGLVYLRILPIYLLLAGASAAIIFHSLNVQVIGSVFKWLPLFFLPLPFQLRRVIKMREASLINVINLDQPLIIELSENCCTVRSKRYYFVYNWPVFVECISTKDHYVLRPKIGSVLIPKGLLQNRTEAAFVDNLVRTKIAKFIDWNEEIRAK